MFQDFYNRYTLGCPWQLQLVWSVADAYSSFKTGSQDLMPVKSWKSWISFCNGVLCTFSHDNAFDVLSPDSDVCVYLIHGNRNMQYKLNHTAADTQCKKVVIIIKHCMFYIFLKSVFFTHLSWRRIRVRHEKEILTGVKRQISVQIIKKKKNDLDVLDHVQNDNKRWTLAFHCPISFSFSSSLFKKKNTIPTTVYFRVLIILPLTNTSWHFTMTSIC